MNSPDTKKVTPVDPSSPPPSVLSPPGQVVPVVSPVGPPPVGAPDPSNGWNTDIENLLKTWIKQIEAIVKNHTDRGNLCKKLYLIFGAILILFQTGSLVTLINNVASVAINNEYNSTDPYSQIAYDQARINANDNLTYAITALQIFILIVQGLDKFFNWSTGAEKHFTTANDFNGLSRFISVTLSLKRKDRDAAKDVLNSIQSQFNDIMKNAPLLPDSPELQVPDAAPEDDAKDLKINIGPDLSGDGQVSDTYRSKFMVEYQKQKLESARENQKPGVLGNLQYQWQRFEEMGDSRHDHEGSEGNE